MAKTRRASRSRRFLSSCSALSLGALARSGRPRFNSTRRAARSRARLRDAPRTRISRRLGRDCALAAPLRSRSSAVTNISPGYRRSSELSRPGRFAVLPFLFFSFLPRHVRFGSSRNDLTTTYCRASKNIIYICFSRLTRRSFRYRAAYSFFFRNGETMS